MAVRIPLIVDYNGKGLERLKREFAQLDGVAAKSKFALQKAFLPATAVLGGLAAAGKTAVDAAIADQRAQTVLAKVLQTTTKATNKQIAAVEEWISQTERAFTFNDEKLRPALADLVRVTRDVTKAQGYLALAMDVSVGTGKELSEVTDAFTKAIGGNMRGLRSLSPELFQMIKDGAALDDVMGQLSATFGGAAAAEAETAAGKMQILNTRFSELVEGIGYKLLPIMEKYLIPALEKFTTWAENNPGTIKIIAAAFGVLAASIVAVNVAMMLNPWVLLTAGLITLAGVTAHLWRTNERFRDGLKSIWEWLGKLADRAKPLLDLLGPLASLGGTISNIGSKGWKGLIPNLIPGISNSSWIPFMAEGGIVTAPTLAMIGEGNEPEAVIPLSRLGDMSGGGTTNVTINVSGADPQAVVNALVRWSRQNGALPYPVRLT